MLSSRPHKSPRLNWWSWCLLAVCFVVGRAWGQEIIFHLRNGDRITGRVISESTNQVAITTSFAGQLILNPADIQRREPSPPRSNPSAPVPAPALAPTAPASKTQELPPVAPPPAAGALPSPTRAAAADNSKAPAKPKSSISADAEEAQRLAQIRKFLADWKGELQLGLNLGFSTKNRQNYTGRLKAQHVHGPMKNTLDYSFSYGRTEGVLSDNQMDGSWRIEYDVPSSRRFHIYNSAGAGYDEIQRIDLRYDLGPGVGYKWLTLTNLVLKTELGANYQKQLFADETEKTRYGLRLAEDLTWAISSKLKFDEKIEFYPKIDDFGDFRLRLEANLTYLLRNNLTLNVTLVDIYDTATPSGVSHNDLQIRSSIGVKF